MSVTGTLLKTNMVYFVEIFIIELIDQCYTHAIKN